MTQLITQVSNTEFTVQFEDPEQLLQAANNGRFQLAKGMRKYMWFEPKDFQPGTYQVNIISAPEPEEQIIASLEEGVQIAKFLFLAPIVGQYFTDFRWLRCADRLCEDSRIAFAKNYEGTWVTTLFGKTGGEDVSTALYKKIG